MTRRSNWPVRMAVYAGLALAASCALRTSDAFRVLPATPVYEIQSPALERTPYDEVLDAHTARGDGWIELKAGMGIFIQYALFLEGSTKHTIETYVGTESIRYEVAGPGELTQFGEVSRMDPRPRDALPVDQLISERQREKKHHRFFYQVLIRTPELKRVAALVSSDTPEQLQLLTEKLASGAAALEDVSPDHYTLLPENASAAVELSFTVDGTQTRAIWGSRLAGVVKDSRRPKLFRLYEG
jgi:hypothetical protein